MAKLKLPAQGIGDTLPEISMDALSDGSLVEHIVIGTVSAGVFFPSSLALDSTLQALVALMQAPLSVLPPVVTAAALTNVPASLSAQPLAPLNAARKGLVVVNDSTSILYVKCGSAAAPTSWSYLLAGSQAGVPATLELPQPIYTGLVTGIWASATGNARVTEFS